MPTDPIHASDDLLERAREYRDIQKEISENFFKEEQSLTQIVDIYKKIDKSMINRLVRQRELTDLIKKSKETIIQAEKASASALGTADEKRRKLMEASAKQQLSNLTKEYEMLEQINYQALIPWLYFFDKAWKLFLSMDNAAASFRLKMGIVRDNMIQIRELAQKLTVEFMNVGVNIEEAYESIAALGKEMGSIRIVSYDLVKATTLLKAQLGVAEEDSAGFFRNMAALSKTTMESQINMAYMAQDLSQAAGIPFPQIMNDVAKLSSQTLTMISRVPNQILKSAIEARRMNSSLNEMARGSREILNFSDSINSEMEASVLLGRSINLQHARELAYKRDIVGSTKEILRITKSIDFENLDVFQQEAFARATGRSVDELLKMVQAEKQLDAARRSSDPAIRAQANQLDNLLKLNEAQAIARAKDIGIQIQQNANQARLVSITQKWNQILAQGASVLLPIVDTLLSMVPAAIDVARSFFGVYAVIVSIGKIFYEGGLLLATWTQEIVVVSEWFTKLAIYGEKILSPIVSMTNMFAKVGGFIGSWIGPLAKFIAPFFKILAPIGWVITAFQAIYGLITGWNDGVKQGLGFWEKLGSAIMGGLRAIIPGFDWIIDKVKYLWSSILLPMAEFTAKWLNWPGLIFNGLKVVFSEIYNYIVGIFSKAWDYVTSWWGGHSPSKLGLTILQGIVSVGAMIFDALTSPWRKGLEWISDKIPGMSKFADKLRGGATEFLNTPLETKVATSYIPAATFSPNGNKLATTGEDKTNPTTVKAEDKSQLMTEKTGQAIVDKLDALLTALKGGQIGINMDGSLLSTNLARHIEFKGNYGVNT